ncbi:MAG: SCO family protein [Acidobacteria bacterium]|nr:SCO family protein [Acidobacteriota bacterium]
MRLKSARSFVSFCLLSSVFCLLSSQTFAQVGQQYSNSPLYGARPELGSTDNGLPQPLQQVGIDQKLNEQVPLDITFKDETGREVRLSEYFNHGRPVIITLVYYQCPMLCDQVLNALTGTLKSLSFDVGKEYEVLTVSFDPRETPEMAAAKKDEYMARYGRAGAAEGWHFLTGEQKSIDALAKAVGFRYTYDEKTKQFAHASGIMLATPEGKLSHYFYGIEYAPKELRLGIVEASAGKVGTPVDALMLYCFHYDPTSGKYGLAIMNIVRLLGVLTVIGIVALLLILRRRGGGRVREEELAAGGVA